MDWIRQHPVVDAYTISSHHEKSIEAEIASLVFKRVGLKLKLIELDRPLSQYDPLPIVVMGGDARASGNPFIYSHYKISVPYKPLIRLYVTKNNHKLVTKLSDLDERSLGVLENSYTSSAQNGYLDIHRFKNQKALLDAVSKGEVEAALLLREDAFYELPKHRDLVMNGFEDVSSTNVFLVSNKEPILLSILNKTLLSFDSRELHDATMNWLDHTDQNIPEIGNVWKGYRWGLLSVLAVMIALIFALYVTRKAYRIKMESEATKSKFLAMMSHELRTPLGVIITVLELLQNSLLDQYQRKMLGQAQSAGANLMELFNNILDMSRIGLHQIELESQPTSVSNLVRDLHQQYLPLAEEKGIDFT
ncbi:histidine kinase dimerization/phospho-acceptor domain-containing protein, partial [Chromobacterium sp. ASV23]|uniref:histidine kinase dimerization/phospho-acceptor domain-containing protein n=1 Tax=Chromobacterium sp. ASV23 TaxID=2795110 RepID=UPI0027149EAC